MDHCSDYLITDVDVDQGGTPPPSPPSPNYPTGGGGGSSSSSDTVTGVVDTTDVTNALSGATTGGSATIDISTNPIMSAEGFEALASAPDKTLVWRAMDFHGALVARA